MVIITSSGRDLRVWVRTTIVRNRRMVAFLVSASVCAPAIFLSFLVKQNNNTQGSDRDWAKSTLDTLFSDFLQFCEIYVQACTTPSFSFITNNICLYLTVLQYSLDPWFLIIYQIRDTHSHRLPIVLFQHYPRAE